MKKPDPKSSESRPKKSTTQGVDLEATLPEVLNHSGRVSAEYLKHIALMTEVGSFMNFVTQPVLAGSAIREGEIVTSGSHSMPAPRKRGRTLMFKPAELLLNESRKSVDSEPIQRAVYALIKGPNSATPDQSRFTIGRELGTDLVIPDFTISSEHAEIRVRAGRYFLADLGSSNGTFLNGIPVGDQGVEIYDKDTVTFARIELTVFFPETLHRVLRGK